MTDKSGAMQVDAALVRQLSKLLDEGQLTEIEVQDGERRIRVARSATVASAAAPAIATAAQAAPAAPAADSAPAAIDNSNALKSPMVGTVYLLPEPGAKPFASVGDTVAAGATLLIIEAMKVMNPILAPKAGKISRVCVQNGQPVEYDQPLIVID